jgi:hypothetical protein
LAPLAHIDKIIKKLEARKRQKREKAKALKAKIVIAKE